MLLALAFLGGVLTILSPCILPILPFVFTRTGKPFLRNGLPLLAGMTVMFAAVATLAAVGGGWVVRANEWGRWLALALMMIFGLALLLPAFANRLMQPVVALGNRLSNSDQGDGSVASSFVLGAATGMLWAPCAGPILGLILTGAALNGANVETSMLLFAYAAGSAVSLAAALLLGGKVFAALKRSLGAEEWMRRALGAAVLIGAVAIALGLDTGLLARISTASTTKLEEFLFSRLLPDGEQPSNDVLLPGPAMAGNGAMMAGGEAMVSADSPAMMSGNSPAMMSGNNPAMMAGGAMQGGAAMSARDAAAAAAAAAVAMPPLDGATTWLNSEPLTAEALRGRVVLIDFWTYSCINCIRALPYVRAWHEKYHDQGLVVIGVHSPEFAFEKSLRNVEREVRELEIDYPVAVDNDYAIWRAFSNRYWPAHYFVDATGNIRHTHFGEGAYDESERVIQQLLVEAGRVDAPGGLVTASGEGAALPADEINVLSPETYIGHERAESFVSPGGQVPDAAQDYTVPQRLGLNDWALAGNWTVHAEDAVLNSATGSVVFRFQARDLHLVLGPSEDGQAIRFRVRIDGQAPGDNHGTDVDVAGEGSVVEHRLYQLIRQSGAIRDHLFEIEFLDPGVMAYAFTFG